MLADDAWAGACTGWRWDSGATGTLLGGAGEGLRDLKEGEAELEEGACEHGVLGWAEIGGGSIAEDGEHVDGLLGAEEVDLGLLAFLGASAELQDGLHVDGLDERLEGEGGGVVGAGIGGADSGFEAVGGGLVGEPGLLHLLSGGSGRKVGVEIVGGLTERISQACGDGRLGSGDALRDLADRAGGVWL